MKRLDFFCTSQASTAVCSNTDERSMVLYSNKPPQHHQAPPSPLHHDRLRKIRTSVPCSSQPPITPRRSSFAQRTLTSAPCSSQLPINPRRSCHTQDTRTSTPCSFHLPITPKNCSYTQKPQKSIQYSYQQPITPRRSSYVRRTHDSSSKELLISDIRKSCAEITDVSSRRLLSDRPFFELLSESDRIKPSFLKLRSVGTPRLSKSSSDHDSSPPLKPAGSSTPHTHDQVVVLKVSLHCKGCESKVRKHISRMEGVKSFDIDFITKKVTIIGDLTPAEVLASVSKVKIAQLWPSTSTTTSSSSSSSSSSLFSAQDQPDLLL